jgi:hypothetical protein
MFAGGQGSSRRPASVPSIHGPARAEREGEQRKRSAERLRNELMEESEEDIPDILTPDVFTEEDPDDWLLESKGVSSLFIADESGNLVSWPWESSRERHTGSRRRRQRLDQVIINGLMHSMASGDMGVNSTGVKRWKRFCGEFNYSPTRVLDPNAPLAAKLREEWVAMRYIAWLVEDEGLLPRTAATYFSQVQGWHAKEHGIKLAGGIKLNRLPAMLKGLRRVYCDGGRKVRRGITPQALRDALDTLYPDASNVEHANIRAALTLAFQGLLRGAEFATDGKFNPKTGMTRADVATLTAERLVVMMRPCKNMQHLTGKTCPLIIGGGGFYVDAVREMQNLLKVDPVASDAAARTPLFRIGAPGQERSALSTRYVLAITKSLMRTVGEDPSQFGAHSYRIGGATALFAAGADPTIIRTMGRWSSDCYRLYVRACFGQTLAWSKKCGSQEVSDVAKEFAEVDSY